MRTNPDITYMGIYNTGGYKVFTNNVGLPYHYHYARHRCWHTVKGLNQLALDILIDAFDEPLPSDVLEPDHDIVRVDMTSAWVPHLHYASTLAALSQRREHGHWTLAQPQVIAWMYDWMERLHRLTALRRYPSGYYRGMPFEAWDQELTNIMQRFGAYDLPECGMTMPRKVQYYLAGNLPQDVSLLWCRSRIGR